MQSAPSDSGVVVLRLGEIFLKGRNRRRFSRALVDNARRLLAPLEGVTVQPLHLRVLVRHPARLERQVLERLAHLFGLHSMAPARVVARGARRVIPQDLDPVSAGDPFGGEVDAIAAAAVAEARALAPGTTFKVESNRRDKSFPIRSPELSRLVGGRVAAETGLPVDVHAPARTIRVEVSEDASLVFSRLIPGPGGLPVGTAGHVSLLLSGGIDSPVAGWSAMRRGCTASAIYFHSFPFTGDKTKEKVLDLARRLAVWHGPLTVQVVHFTEVQKALRGSGPAELAVVLYRRMMMRTASILAARDRAKALVTGENLGQVASQTLDNLGVIEQAASLPVLRPLVTFDKIEIIRRAEEIGTYELSIQPYDDCCALFVPKHPATRARLIDAQRAEAGLDVDSLARSLADAAEQHRV